MVWAEHFLARPDDPYLSSGTFPSELAPVWLGNTVTYFIQADALSSSIIGGDMVHEALSIPIWNGVILRNGDMPVEARESLPHDRLPQILAKALVAFSIAYDFEGIVFCELDQ
jgi:hypothetical protein